MKRILMLFLICFIVSCSLPNDKQNTRFLTEPVAKINPLQKQYPYLVKIEKFRYALRSGNGNGVIIDPSGIILTVAHLIYSYDITTLSALVYEKDTLKRYQLKLISSDKIMDIAVLKIISQKNDFPYIKPHQKYFPDAGTPVKFIGYTNEKLIEVNGKMTNVMYCLPKRKFIYPDILPVRVLFMVIKCSTGLKEGLSGCPLFTKKGELIGVCSALVIKEPDLGLVLFPRLLKYVKLK